LIVFPKEASSCTDGCEDQEDEEKDEKPVIPVDKFMLTTCYGWRTHPITGYISFHPAMDIAPSQKCMKSNYKLPGCTDVYAPLDGEIVKIKVSKKNEDGVYYSPGYIDIRLKNKPELLVRLVHMVPFGMEESANSQIRARKTISNLEDIVKDYRNRIKKTEKNYKTKKRLQENRIKNYEKNVGKKLSILTEDLFNKCSGNDCKGYEAGRFNYYIDRFFAPNKNDSVKIAQKKQKRRELSDLALKQSEKIAAAQTEEEFSNHNKL